MMKNALSRPLISAFLLSAFAVALTAPALAQAAKTLPAPPREEPAALEGGRSLQGAARVAALTKASKVLDSMSSVEGRFLQIAPDGSSTQGRFYLQRPGKVRFEYDAPAPLTIVSDGATVAVSDRSLKTVDRTPLRATPLYFVLKRDVDLEKDAKITRVADDGGTLAITARDKKGQADGQITLLFDGPELELRQWRVLDGQGQLTQVALQDVRQAGKLDPALFILRDANDPTARRPIK